MDQKLVLTDSSRMTTGHGRVGQNRLLNGVEPHTTGCVRFDPVFSTLRISMNRLRFRFEPKREKNRTEPDFQTLVFLAFVSNLQLLSGLQTLRHGVTVKEQAAIFLYTCMTGLSIRHIGERFQRS